MIQSGIRRKLFYIHIILVIWVIASMGINSYRSQWMLWKEITEQYHNDISQRFVGPVSLAIAGNNYANVALPVFNHELVNLPSLIYMGVEGFSDTQSKYAITYYREDKQVRRAQYDDEYEKTLSEKIQTLSERKSLEKKSKKKIDYLLARANDELSQYRENKMQRIASNKTIDKLLVDSKGGFNAENWLLRVEQPTTNNNGGSIVFIYDISNLQSIRNDVISNSILEGFLSLLISFPLIWMAGKVLVKPIESLTSYISSNVNDIDPQKIPAVERKDEIGFLAQRFQALVTNANSYIKEIESLSVTDPLTGLYNRRYYRQTVSLFMEEARRSGSVLSFLYIDLDSFKKYNDNYGHALGDDALKKVASVFTRSLQRRADLCFRWGGEEFLILVKTGSVDSSLEIAERIRQGVQTENIEHKVNGDHDCLTISIGIASCRFDKGALPSMTDSDMLAAADNELYKVKVMGGNAVGSIEVSCPNAVNA